MSLLGFGLKLFRNHWKILVAIAIFPQFVSYIGSLLHYSQNFSVQIAGIIISIIALIFSVAGVVASVDAIHKLSSDETAKLSLIGQYKIGFKLFWSVVFVGIVIVLVGLGSYSLLIIPGIIVTVYTSVYLFTLIVDGRKGFSSLNESFSLVYSRWWPVLGRMVFLVVITIAIFVIAGFIVSGIGVVAGVPLVAVQGLLTDGQAGPQFGFLVLSGLVNMIVSAIVGPIALGYSYRMYISLKAIRISDTPTIRFKRWLVAFLAIGIIGIILTAVLIPTIAVLTFGDEFSNSEFQTQVQPFLNEESLIDGQINQLSTSIENDTNPDPIKNE